jgi:uracil-DNA glycosylase
MQALDKVDLTVLVGGYAHKYHLGVKTGVTDTVRGWRDHAPRIFTLPHPSWRNTAWLRKHPWFEAEVLPELCAQIQRVIHD